MYRLFTSNIVIVFHLQTFLLSCLKLLLLEQSLHIVYKLYLLIELIVVNFKKDLEREELLI